MVDNTTPERKGLPRMVEKTAAKSPMNVATLIAGLASVFKAIPSDKMEDMKDVLDLWNTPDGEHKNPSRAEIVTGPAERMSGDGAVKMIGEYSSPAPQQGLTAQYSEFQRMLDGWGKAFTDKLNPVLARHDTALKSILDVFSQIQKAQTEVPAAPAADSFLGKALLKISKAKLALRKADMADDDEKEERKSHLADASDLLKAAKRLLAKASEDMEETDDDAAEKALTSLSSLTKAVAKAEKEDKEWEETEKAKAVATQKAIDDAAAATKKAEDDKKKEEDEAAEKAKAVAAPGSAAEKAIIATAEQAAMVQKALDGLALLPATVQTVMDTIYGKSANPIAPEISKGTPAVIVDYAARVEEAIENGTLSEGGEMKARSLVQHMALAKAGRVDMANVSAELEKAPAEVRALFAVAA